MTNKNTQNRVITSAINAIATAEFENDLKKFDWVTEDYRQQRVEMVEQELGDLLQAMKEGRYYTRVESVAKSGLSRIISIAYVKDNEIHGVPDYVYKMAGCDKNRRIKGCGMDMLFAAQHNLWYNLTDEAYQDNMARYKDF